MVADPAESGWRFGRTKTLRRHFAVLKAVRASDLHPNDRHVIRVIEDYADAETGLAYPGIRAIAKDTGLGRHAVESALARLRAAGWLEVRPRASPRKTTIYRVTPPSWRVHGCPTPVPDPGG